MSWEAIIFFLLICREDVAAGQIVSDPAFRRRLQPASAAPVPRMGDLTTPACLCLSVHVSVHVPVRLLVPPSELLLVPLHT